MTTNHPQPNAQSDEFRWTATVKFTLRSGPDVAMHPVMSARLDAVFSEVVPAVTQGANWFRVAFGVPANNYTDAQSFASALIDDACRELGLASDAVSEVRVIANSEIDAEIADLPACVGVGEAAELLGISKQRIGQLSMRADFPIPVFRLKATPVWRYLDVLKFDEDRKRRTGSR